MNKLNYFMALIFVLSIAACQNEYGLEDGLYAKFDTNFGDFIAELDYEKAPMTTANFVALAEGNHPKIDEKYENKKYFDSLTFHRIVPGFVIQGGDPLGTGMGGPGYEFPNETSEDLKHDEKGVLSMANAGPDTNGSQFFITLAPTPNLDGGYSVFGKVIEGIEVVDSIAKTELGIREKPKEDVVMKSVEIIRIGKEAKKFDAPAAFQKGIADKERAEQEAKEELERELNELAEGYEKTESGLRYKIINKVRDGKRPQPGQTIYTYYKGMFTNGRVFDQKSEEKGDDPLSFQVGTGRVIAGWDEGLQLLREGEDARFIIPPHLAYGTRGVGPIPPNSILIFDVKLEKIED